MIGDDIRKGEMKKQLSFFGIPFCVYTEQQLFRESCDFLEEPSLYSIFFVTAEQCSVLSEAKNLIKNRGHILWLSGDGATHSLFPKKERHTLSEFSVSQYIMQICEYSADMGLEVCILMEDEADLELVTKNIRTSFPYLVFHGLSLEKMTSPEMMVNEINAIAPEILILGIRTSELRRYMEYDRTKTNARLCICTGHLLADEMSKKNKMFHTITMSRRLKKNLHKYNKKEQAEHGTI